MRIATLSTFCALGLALSACASPTVSGGEVVSLQELEARQQQASTPVTVETAPAVTEPEVAVPATTEPGNTAAAPEVAEALPRGIEVVESSGTAQPEVDAESTPVETTTESAVAVTEVKAEPAAAEPQQATLPAEITLGDKYREAGDLRAARSAYTLALTNELDPAVEHDVISKLDAINGLIFLSTAENGDMQTYTVAGGDTLGRIASRYGTTWEFLRRLNDLPNSTIRVGQKLMVPKGSFTVRVSKSKFSLDLLLNGDFIKRYSISTGLGNSTPEGVFSVMNRIEKPKDGGYDFGDPRHRLGTHWLGLKGEDGYQGYGIHGTPATEEDKIGSEASKGCVRLRNEQVAELYDLLPVGTKVTINA